MILTDLDICVLALESTHNMKKNETLFTVWSEK